MKAEKFTEKKVELNDNEKVIFDLLQSEHPVDLNTLKDKAGLSNKQWDKGIKGLTKQNLAKVTKTDDALTVDLV